MWQHEAYIYICEKRLENRVTCVCINEEYFSTGDFPRTLLAIIQLTPSSIHIDARRNVGVNLSQSNSYQRRNPIAQEDDTRSIIARGNPRPFDDEKSLRLPPRSEMFWQTTRYYSLIEFLPSRGFYGTEEMNLALHCILHFFFPWKYDYIYI